MAAPEGRLEDTDSTVRWIRRGCWATLFAAALLWSYALWTARKLEKEIHLARGQIWQPSQDLALLKSEDIRALETQTWQRKASIFLFCQQCGTVADLPPNKSQLIFGSQVRRMERYLVQFTLPDGKYRFRAQIQEKQLIDDFVDLVLEGGQSYRIHFNVPLTLSNQTDVNLVVESTASLEEKGLSERALIHPNAELRSFTDSGGFCCLVSDLPTCISAPLVSPHLMEVFLEAVPERGSD